MTSDSVLLSTNTTTAFNSVFAKESIGMNNTTSFDGNQQPMIDKMSPNMSRLMLTAVIPGIMAGIFIILVSLMLCVLARRMGHLIRVGADRGKTKKVLRSFSEEATIHESEENLSVYELVERGNPSGVNENQPSVANPVYHRDEQIVFHDPPKNVKTPDGTEAIYAEPFGHIGGKKTQSTALTPLDNAPGYQNLLGTKLESVEYASRYSVPQAESLQVPSHDGLDQAMQNGPNTCTSEPSSNTGETLPNMERKEKYALRDILVEDLDIETCEASEDLFEEMCVRPSFLVEEKTIPERQDCGACNNIPENAITVDPCSTTKLNERPQTSKRQIETLERHPCTVNEMSIARKAKAGSLEKFKTFFKLTL
ncbi:uncharacterized protein LOC144628107 [Oculina patagonica]